MKPLEPKAGQVFVSRSKATRTPSRRVIEVRNIIGIDHDNQLTGELLRRVCYSIGGDSSRWCSLREFRCWVRRHNAVKTRTRRPRTMVLR